MRVVLINGPNLDLLGTREPEVYGSTSLGDLESMVSQWGSEMGIEVSSLQSNHEGALIEAVHGAASHDAVIINPGAFTHTSRALADAIASVDVPTVEVHISNVKTREPWRSESVVSDVCVRTIYGRGLRGYRDGLRHLANRAQSPFVTVRYGPHPENVGDLRGVADAPGLVVLVHGGFLLREWERDTIESLAVDLTGRGYSTWNLEYRRLGVGGGWPGSAHDIKMALEFVPQLEGVGEAPVAVVGHSAGGYLALWSGVRALTGPPRATIALSAITDLEERLNGGPGAEVAHVLIESGAPARLDAVPPRTTLIHAKNDTLVPPTHSSRLEGVAAVEIVSQTGHFDLLDPAKAHWPAVITALEGALV
jgi:3-dehydroquinate dehydratase-2